MTGSIASFPVPLVCPACGARLASPRCACAAGTHFEIDRGIPRLLFGQKYWGETSSANMARILELTERLPWREAMDVAVPGENVTKHLTASVRAEFVHAMPWNEIRTVLDIGAGMGFLTCDLARYAENVVALEAVPERARFIQTRARQDRLSIHPIVASAMAMPFEPESFDLITLNGVFEYIGLWGSGDPKMLQQKFLQSALRLLRPNGYLYVGIETRYGYGTILGGRDHSGLPFTSLMPRRMADWYCRLRTRPFYGSEHAVRGYRTYTYTPRQYHAMFERAGFGKVDVFGVLDGYNSQRIVYNLDRFLGRKTMLERLNPPTSLAGKLRRLWTDNRLLYKTLENEVVIFARKGAATGPLAWGELVDRGETVAQFATDAGKLLTFVFEGGRPVTVVERLKPDAPVADRLPEAYGVLRTAQSLYGAEAASWPMRWPAPGGTAAVHGHTAYEYEFADGYSIASRLLPAAYREAEILPVIERVIAVYPELCARLASRWPKRSSGEYWQQLADAVETVASEPELQRRLRQGVKYAHARGWALGLTHGDLSTENVVVQSAGQFILIDWEHFSEGGVVAADLVRFFYDSCLVAKRLPPRKYAAFVVKVRAALARQLQAMGFIEVDFDAIEALFIAHQIHCKPAMAIGPLVEMYLRQSPLVELKSANGAEPVWQVARMRGSRSSIP